MLNRYASEIRLASIVAMMLAILVLMRELPMDDAIIRVHGIVERAGWLAPVLVAVLFIVASVLMLPGSPITLLAAAVLGIVPATIAVSIGSTLGAGAAFLISRHLARGQMTSAAKNRRTIAVLDRAIARGGWRIVALTRLSPLFPFNLQNYAYGLTAVRFWPYLVTSWLAMLPGTFMFVYLGHVGGQTVSSVAGASDGNSTREWIVLAAGLVPTVLVTIYLSRLASREMAAIASESPQEEANMNNDSPTSDTPARRPMLTVMLIGAAVLLVSAAACAQFSDGSVRQLINGIFGPPAVELEEAYEDAPAEATGDTPAKVTFDHSSFDRLLKQHVDADGWIDYAGMAREVGRLDSYIAAVGKAPFDSLGRDEKLAFLINAYNAFTLKLIIDHWDGGKLKSIKDIDKPWDTVRWNLAGTTVSLSQLEHEYIRPKFKEPRIHFALVCAAVGCPKLRNEVFTAKKLEAQLDDQTRYVHSHGRWFKFDARANTVSLTKLYDWYGGDFKQVSGTVLKYAAKYSDELASHIRSGKKPTVKWLPYAWELNDKRNKQRTR